MTVKNIMSQELVKLKPTDRVCDALNIMHDKQIRNLPVVDDDDQFVGLFGIGVIEFVNAAFASGHAEVPPK